MDEQKLREIADAVKLLTEAGMRVKGLPAEVEHPDDHWMTEEEKHDANRWDQIGGWENIARRRARAQGVPVDSKYQGPEATKEEREQAYKDLLAANPHIQRIDL